MTTSRLWVAVAEHQIQILCLPVVSVAADKGPPHPPTPLPPCGWDEQKLEVDILIDTYASETSWEITDVNGEEIASESADKYPNSHTLYSTRVCLGCGEYTFKIFDGYGDGLCCSYGHGGYNLTLDGHVIHSGSNFGSSDSKEIEGC